MLKPVYSNSHKDCLKRDKKRGYDFTLLEEIVEQLVQEIPLDPKHRDHALTGNYAGFRECHIKPNWLLIYYIEDDTIVFVKTGTHSDLFKK